MKKIITIFISSIFFNLSAHSVVAVERIFFLEDHCLAYKTEKTVFFFFDEIEVIGKSCEVTAEMRWNDSGEQAQVEVSVPVTSFDSGNFVRDSDISEILRAELTPNIRFISNWLSRTELQKMLENQKTEVSGNLEVAGNSFLVNFPLNSNVQGEFILIEGQLITSFSAIKVEVPTVGPGGLLAEPKDFLELLVHLRSDKFTGVEKAKTRNE